MVRAWLLTMLCLILPATSWAQGVTGLLARGRAIAFPRATLPSLTPLATAEFRIPGDSAGSLRVGWSIGAVRDDLDRLGTGASVRAPAGRFVVHASFERASVRNLEEISDFDRTGAEIPAHDGRLEVGVATPLRFGVWGATSVRYAESVLADRRGGFGELIVAAGWRHARGFESAVESGVVTFARASASDEERNPYGRIAVLTPAIVRVRFVAGMTWNELGVHRERPVNVGGALRVEPWGGRVIAIAGSEWGPTGIAESAAEVALRASPIMIGTRVTRQAPGMNGIHFWVASAR